MASINETSRMNSWTLPNILFKSLYWENFKFLKRDAIKSHILQNRYLVIPDSTVSKVTD